MGFEFKAIIAFAFLALGIAAPLPEFVGGMLLGMGGCFGVMLLTPAPDRSTMFATLFAGLVVCLFAALAHPHLPFGTSELPIQLVMGAAGGASRYIGGILIELGKGGMERARKIPSELKFPGGKSK